MRRWSVPVIEPERPGVGTRPSVGVAIGADYSYRTAPRSALVSAARARLAARLGVGVSDFVLGEQVHGGEVCVVEGSMRGSGATRHDTAVPGVDALVTQHAGVALGVLVADCMPVAIWARSGAIVGMAHAGWRGAAAGIVGSTVRAVTDLGASLEEVHAWLGPCLCPRCLVVGQEVCEAFIDLEVRSRAFSRPRDGRLRLDLRTAAEVELLKLGVPASQVERSPLCTWCSAAPLHSFRRDGDKSGRMLAYVLAGAPR